MIRKEKQTEGKAAVYGTRDLISHPVKLEGLSLIRNTAKI